MTQEEMDAGRTFPAIERIREVSFEVACAIIKQGFVEGLNVNIREEDFVQEGQLEAFVRRKMYSPYYVPLVDPSFTDNTLKP